MWNIGLKVFDRLMQSYENFKVEQLKSHFLFCGERVEISRTCVIISPSMLEVGDDVTINSLTHIFAGGGVKIGSGTMISSNCSITSVTHRQNSLHRHKDKIEEGEELTKLIVIGENVWIGTGAIILPGVTIGDHSVVGAGAVVTRDVPEKVIVAGVPAKIVKTLSI